MEGNPWAVASVWRLEALRSIMEAERRHLRNRPRPAGVQGARDIRLHLQPARRKRLDGQRKFRTESRPTLRRQEISTRSFGTVNASPWTWP